MVESGLDEVVISLDGASQETYSKYRCGGDFNKVINSLTLLVSKRKDAHKKQPFVIVQFIVMKHNEHEIYLIEEIAKNLGVDRLIITSVRLPDEIDHDFAKNFLPEDSKYSQYLSPAKNEIAFKDIRKICYAPWEEISIAWDGTVYICCYDIIKTSIKQYIYGNVFTGETIKSIWNSKDYILFRKKLLESKNKDEICTNCRGYKPFGDFHLGFFGNKMHDI
jgi:radical SAM protein with 4Fe4S-binding SPASM domain